MDLPFVNMSNPSCVHYDHCHHASRGVLKYLFYGTMAESFWHDNIVGILFCPIQRIQGRLFIGNLCKFYLSRSLTATCTLNYQVSRFLMDGERLIKVPDHFQDARIMIEGHPKISMTHDHIILRMVYCMLTYNQPP